MKNNDVYIERVLPKEGELNIKTGAEVEPFTKLGITKVSYGELPIKGPLKLHGNKRMGDFFYTGDTIGKIRTKKVIAPFDGRIRKEGKKYIYKQEEKDFWLLSGVWGEVVDIQKEESVLLKTQTIDIHFSACTKISYAGELIVFPNPSDLLKLQYLEKFSKDSFGKIIYLGDHVDLKTVKKAANLGVAGLLAGSADREAFAFAKKEEMFLGVFSGFGDIPTPGLVFEFLKDISNRFVFLQGSRGVLRIPNPKRFPEDKVAESSDFARLVEVKEGMNVQIFEAPYFGFTGKISDVQDGSVYVILDEVEDSVEVSYPNLLAL